MRLGHDRRGRRCLRRGGRGGAALSGLRDRALGTLARFLAALPEPLLRRLAGRPIRLDGQQLHPQVQVALRLEHLSGGSELLPVELARQRRREEARIFAGPPIDLASIEDFTLPGPVGPIPVRVYVPRAIERPAPLVVYLHGGGHVVGGLDTHDQPCRLLARDIPALVLAVDYRLAPEHPFPAAVEDAFAAFRAAHAEAEALDADPERIAIAGDSAGGNLAAAICALAAADGGPAPCFQALIYPVTDYSRKRRSYELFAEGFFLTSEEMDWYRDHYFSEPAERGDPRASPILAADLSGQPPALVISAGFDPLRDEGEDYAERLREAGVEVTLRRESDLVHGFINAAGLGGRAAGAMEPIVAALREGLRAGEPSPVDGSARQPLR